MGDFIEISESVAFRIREVNGHLSIEYYERKIVAPLTPEVLAAIEAFDDSQIELVKVGGTE